MVSMKGYWISFDGAVSSQVYHNNSPPLNTNYYDNSILAITVLIILKLFLFLRSSANFLPGFTSISLHQRVSDSDASNCCSASGGTCLVVRDCLPRD